MFTTGALTLFILDASDSTFQIKQILSRIFIIFQNCKALNEYNISELLKLMNLDPKKGRGKHMNPKKLNLKKNPILALLSLIPVIW